MELIKVILIIHSAGVGGVEKRFFNLYKYIKSSINNSKFHYTFYFHRKFLFKINARIDCNQNHNICLIPYGLTERWSRFLFFSIIVRIVDLLYLWLLLLISKITMKIDIVHFVTTTALRFRHIFRREKKVASFYNSVSTREKIVQKYYQRVLQEDIFLDCLSSDISRIYLYEAKVPDHKVFTSPCSFIDYEGTFFDPQNKSNIVSFVGKFNEQKGFHLLLESLVAVVQNMPEITFFLIGYGPLAERAKKIISENNLQDNVFLFFNPNPKEILIKSLVFLSLQNVDNYPSQSLIEAMACGNAIVATNVGLTELLVDSSNGILIEKNQEELSSAIIKLCKEKKSTLEKCSHSRKKVLEQHSADRFLSYLNNLYIERLMLK